MIITIHQPEHLPWLGYFNKMAKADVFVILDSVQFEKNNYQNRNRILGDNGAFWIHVPVVNQGRLDTTIAETNIAKTANPKWQKKYISTIYTFYHKCDYFSEVFPLIEKAIMIDTEKVIDINLSMIYDFAEALDIHPQFVKSSELNSRGSKTDLLLNICNELHAEEYIAGAGGREYMELDKFQNAGVRVSFNDYHHPIYPQMRSKEFVPYLSVIDLAMNVGWIKAKEIMMLGNEKTSAL